MSSGDSILACGITMDKIRIKGVLPNIPILYKGVNYMVINKPFNILSQPGYKLRNLRNCMVPVDSLSILEIIKRQHGGENWVDTTAEWQTITSLNKVATGGVLIALNKNSDAMFKRNLKKGGYAGYFVRRRYVALLEGTPNKRYFDKGYLFNGRLKSKYKRFDDNCVVFDLYENERVQLRQIAAGPMRQPILNDVRYGAKIQEGSSEDQIAMHAVTLETKIGLQRKKHMFPMVFQNDGKLWKRKYVMEDGNFTPELLRLITAEWDDII